MSGSTTPAGWYPDPGGQGLVRYWDGTGWTQHTSPEKAPPTPASSPVMRPPVSPEEAARRSKVNRRWAMGVGVGLLALVAFAAVTSGRPTRTSEKPGQSAKLDASATLACYSFREFLDDGADGVLTVSEARSALQEVDDDAQYSSTPGIAVASRQMLAAATSDRGSLMDAMQSMTDACAGG